MERPVSIINFERCYLGAIAVGLVGSIVNWSHTQSMVQVQRAQQMIGTWYLPTILAMGIIVPLLLWYFAARRASSVAKWIIVVFFGFSCLGVLVGMAGHTYPPGLAGVLGIAAFVLNAIAVARLFKSDARVWFGEPPLEGEG